MNDANNTPKGIPKSPPLPTSAHSSRPPPIPRPDSTGKQVIAPPPRRDNTGKQGVAPISEKRAPPPVAKMVSFSPPAPARSGTTDPGGLQTRADTPHPKQKTPLPRVSPPAEEERRPIVGEGASLGLGSIHVPKYSPRERSVRPRGNPSPIAKRLSSLRYSFMCLPPIKQVIISGIFTLAVLGSAAGIIVHSCQREEKIDIPR